MIKTLELTRQTSGWQDELARHIAAGDRVEVRIETPTLSPAEFAERLNISRTSVMKWIERGKIAYEKHNTYYRIPATEIDRFRRWYFRSMAADLAGDL